MAFKWNNGRKCSKCRRWQNAKYNYEIVLNIQFNPRFPLKIHSTMVRVLPKWHLNGKSSENQGNAKGGKMQNRSQIKFDLLNMICSQEIWQPLTNHQPIGKHPPKTEVRLNFG